MDKKMQITFSHATIMVIFLFLAKNCLYLLDTSLINVAGAVNYADVWLVLYIAYVGFIFLKYGNIDTGRPSFLIEVIAIALMCFFSAWQSNRLFGQPLSMGIRPQRFFFVIILGYFGVRKIFAAGFINSESLKKVIINFALIEVILSIIQQLVYKYFVFMYCMANERYGSVRLYLSSSVITLAMFFALEGIINKKNFYKNSIMIFLGILYLLIVIKGRLTTISVIAALLGGFLLMKGISLRKIIYFFAVVALIIGFSNTQMFRELTDVIEVEDGEIKGDTLDIRIEGREHYFERMEKNPYLGGGYPSELYMPAAKASGYYDEIMLNDNGIFGLMYIYGYVGLAVFALLFIRLGYISWVIYKEKNVYFVFMYMILILVQAVNITAWYWQYDGIFVLLLVMCLAETVYKEIENSDTGRKKVRIRFVWKK